ncbi:MAG: hypothetical protein ACPLRZ_07715 [Thermovenabulum sp.]|uniref:hypothetical protein n=1 Tax=Thermovenabulum sp. TaxID=3100335 RepID=UPI003C7990B5
MLKWELEERIREAEELWVADFIDSDERMKILKGYKLQKTYWFGKYRDITLNVWTRGKNKFFEVVNCSTGATKCITKSYPEAYGIARQLAGRNGTLYKLLGG